MKASVAAILSEKHGISVRPGAKGECPFCHQKTFSIKSDDSIGKCFHPSCGRFITPAADGPGNKSSLFDILGKLFEDFHKALVDLQRQDHENAYNYCVKERGIHPRVVMDSMLGVIPSQYSVSELFAPHIAELEAALEAQNEKKKQRGRSGKKVESSIQEQLAVLFSAKEKLANCVNNRAGWLALFYTEVPEELLL